MITVFLRYNLDNIKMIESHFECTLVTFQYEFIFLPNLTCYDLQLFQTYMYMYMYIVIMKIICSVFLSALCTFDTSHTPLHWQVT